METVACLGQDYIETLNEWERAQLDKALAWQRAGKDRFVAYLEAGAALPAATLERYHVVNAGGSRGQYVYLEPRVAEDVPQSEALDYDRVVRRSMGIREAQREGRKGEGL